MSAASKIEWTDATWNPIVGCSIKSPGCTNCYAMKMARRIELMGTAPHYAGTTSMSKAGPVYNGHVAQAPEKTLLEPLRWKKPRKVFVNSMGDLFHESIPDEWIDKVFAVMALCPQHQFQVLTKRAERMRKYFEGCDGSRDQNDPWLTSWHRREGVAEAIREIAKATGFEVELGRIRKLPLPNVWLGVSAERQQEADERIPHLLQTPAAIRFVSAEPLLGGLDLWKWLGQSGNDLVCLGGLDDEKRSDGIKEGDDVLGAVNLPQSHGLPALPHPLALPADGAADHSVQPIDQLRRRTVDGAADASADCSLSPPIDASFPVEQTSDVAANGEASWHRDGAVERHSANAPQLDAASQEFAANRSIAGAKAPSDRADGLAGVIGLHDAKGPICGAVKGHGSSPAGEYKPKKLDWVIVGGESGPGARPMHPDWARSLRDQCEAAGVPFFFKQWGEHAPVGRVDRGDATDPNEFGWERVGKKRAGRLLDGKEHNEWPG